MSESPLITIREAERAAAELVENARRCAEQEVNEAKARVAGLLVEAEEHGRHVANRRHQEALEAARADARQIADNGEGRRAAVADEAAPYLPEAVTALLELVLPAGQSGEA